MIPIDRHRNQRGRPPYREMVKPRSDEPCVLGQLRDEVAQLQVTVRELQEQRDRAIRRRRRTLLLVGGSLSLLVHLALLVYLGSIYRRPAGGAGFQPVSYEFAILSQDELTQLDELHYDDLLAEATPKSEELPRDHPAAEVAAVVPQALDLLGSGAVPTLGGSGDGSGGEPGLGGGGAGTSFFGLSSKGTRFAYIVDRSGSMGQSRKLRVAMRELARSIERLPDYAYFYVVLFSADLRIPPMQRGWTRARKTTARHLIRWLNQVDPGGGTHPGPAFDQVFSLDVRPDVIFFLTDGEITGFTAGEVAAYNARGKRVIINTIAFGDPASQELLRQIAGQSGGAYRFVPTEGG